MCRVVVVYYYSGAGRNEDTHEESGVPLSADLISSAITILTSTDNSTCSF